MMVIRSLAVRQHVMVYGITMTVEGDDTGYGSHIGTNQPFLRPSTKTNELFHSINIFLYSVLRCVNHVFAVLHMLSTSIITLSTNPYHVQLMRGGSSKAKDSLRCESHLQKPKQGRVYALGSVLMWPKLLASGLVL